MGAQGSDRDADTKSMTTSKHTRRTLTLTLTEDEWAMIMDGISYDCTDEENEEHGREVASRIRDALQKARQA